MSNVVNPYEFHGLETTDKAGQLVADCFNCDKESHLYIDPRTFQYDCKSCGESGNVYTFLSKLHSQMLKTTSTPLYEKLSKFRKGIPAEKFKEHRLAYNTMNGSWLLPMNNGGGKIANLLSLVQGRWMGTPSCSMHYQTPDIGRSNSTLYIVEGYWDLIALEWLLEHSGKKGNVLSLPGATTFKPEWGKLLRDRNVIWCGDNDEAGRKGMDKVIATLKKEGVQPTSFSFIKWTGNLADGYDISDLVTSHLKAPRKAFSILDDSLEAVDVAHLSPREGSSVDKAQCDSFKELIKQFKSKLSMDAKMEEALAIILAVVVSVKIPLDPLWVFLVGPPGSGKTTLIETFSAANNYCELISKMSSKALVSGWKGNDGEDCSLLPYLKDRCLMIKDYTAVVSMPGQVQDELYGLLRDAYDGTVRVPYGNNEFRQYTDLTFSLVAGVTDVIHGDNRSTLGERFLKVELIGDDHNSDEQIMASIDSVESKLEATKHLQSYILGFLDRPFDLKKIPAPPDWYKTRILHLSKLAANMRASVDRDSHRHLAYRPRPEVGSRLAKQLVKLGMCLAYVYGEDEITERVYSIVRRVAFDTIKGFNLEIVQALTKREQGMTTLELSNLLALQTGSIKRIMEDLFELRLVIRGRVPNNSALRGRDQTCWMLSAELREIWQNTIPKQIKRKVKVKK